MGDPVSGAVTTAASAKGAEAVAATAFEAVAADSAFLATSALSAAEAASAGAIIDAGTGYALGASAGAAGETGFLAGAGQLAKAVSPFAQLASAATTLLGGGGETVSAKGVATPAPPPQAAQAPSIDALRAKNLALYGGGADNTFASGTGGVSTSSLNLGKNKLLGSSTVLGS